MQDIIQATAVVEEDQVAQVVQAVQVDKEIEVQVVQAIQVNQGIEDQVAQIIQAVQVVQVVIKTMSAIIESYLILYKI